MAGMRPSRRALEAKCRPQWYAVLQRNNAEAIERRRAMSILRAEEMAGIENNE